MVSATSRISNCTAYYGNLTWHNMAFNIKPKWNRHCACVLPGTLHLFLELIPSILDLMSFTTTTFNTEIRCWSVRPDLWDVLFSFMTVCASVHSHDACTVKAKLWHWFEGSRTELSSPNWLIWGLQSIITLQIAEFQLQVLRISVNINCKWIYKQIKVEFLWFSKSPVEFHFECVQLGSVHFGHEWDGDCVKDK